MVVLCQLLRGSEHQFIWGFAPRRQPARTPGGSTLRAPACNSTARTVRLPPTGSRHAGQSVGSATFKARPKNARNGAATRLRRVAFTLLAIFLHCLEAIAVIGTPQQR